MMILIGLFKNPLFRYISLALLMLALLAGIRAHFIHQGKLEGKQEQATQSAEVEKAAQDIARKQVEKQLAQDAERDKVVNAQLHESAAALQSANQALVLVASRRTQVEQTVRGLGDSELHPHIVRAIGLRQAGDQTQGYTPEEERKIAEAIDEQPVLRDQLSQMDAKIKALSDRADQLEQKLNVATDRYDHLEAYTTGLERSYASLYNALPKKGPRTWWTFGLIRGKAKRVDAPDPAALIRPK